MVPSYVRGCLLQPEASPSKIGAFNQYFQSGYDDEEEFVIMPKKRKTDAV
jgi:hypothetical protein